MVRTPTGRTRINYHEHPPVLEALKRIATHRGTTYSDLIRAATREFVLRQGGATAVENATILDLGKTP